MLATCLEKRPTNEKGLLFTKPFGSSSHCQASLPLTIPKPGNSSAFASSRVLESRANELKQALDAISSRTSPTDEDNTATLATFFRQHPTLSYQALKKAEIQFSQKLSSSQTLDLKLLLRLPMTKFRELRTYLVNLGIRILASDRQLYRELKTRRDFSSINVGQMPLLKSANAAKKTDVAYVRVPSDIQNYLQQIIEVHEENNNTWDHECFHNEAWLKIGGDKGGPTTKLVAQVVNVNRPNSATTTEVLAMYEAIDDYDNMQNVFGSYTDSFSKLQQEATLQIGGCQKPVRVFLFGDYEWLTKILGHLGPVSTFPCLWCYIHRDECYKKSEMRTINPHSPMVKNEEGSWVKNPTWYAEERTPGDMKQDLKNCKNDRRNGGDTKKNSKFHHSIFASPILPITTDQMHVVPPTLHIMLGLTVRYYKQVEDAAREADNNSSSDPILAEWQEKTAILQLQVNDESTLISDMEYQKSILEGFIKCNSPRRGNGMSDKCAMASCALVKHKVKGISEGDVSWVKCDSCEEEREEDEKWYHIDCVGLKGEVYECEEFKFECPRCRGELVTPEDVVKWQRQKVESSEDRVNKKKKEKEKAQKELDEVYERVKRVMGERETMLNVILDKELHVKKQAYHSQSFVGNDCKKILGNSDRLLQCLEGLPMQQRYLQLFRKLNYIFKFSRAEFLDQKEVNDLCEACWELGIWFCKNFPEQTIPPKLHILIAHVPESVQVFKTIGLLSEHGIESLHAQVNSDARQYACVRDNKEKLRLVFNLHGHRALVSDAYLRTKKRKCRCGGWYFTDRDNVKVCKKCNEALPS